MEIISAWLVHHKATLDAASPMNYDGSAHMYGVGVVPATNMREALELLDRYLAEQKMEVVELTKCEQYKASNFSEPTEDNIEIKEVVSDALESGNIGYACAVSSDAHDFDKSEEQGDD